MLQDALKNERSSKDYLTRDDIQASVDKTNDTVLKEMERKRTLITWLAIKQS